MKKAKVLFIDDDKEILHLLSNFFEDDFEPILAESGEEGLSLFQDISDIETVVCDINMPGQKGIEVIKNMRKLSTTIPFVFFTAFGSRETLLEAAKYGAFDFIDKPDVSGLFEAVKAAVCHYDSKEECREEEHLSEYRELLKQIGKKEEETP